MRAFDPSAKTRLTAHDVGRFPSEKLFDRLGRAISAAGCLPRKELYEAWEMARRVRRIFRGGRVVDLGGGHGLLAAILLVLDDSSPSAVVVDKMFPASSAKLRAAMVDSWPRLDGRIVYEERDIGTAEIATGDLVVSCHACGDLTDVILGRAVEARAPVAVLPCCHNLDTEDTGSLEGWVPKALAVDLMRARRLADAGYRTWTSTIPAEITPKNRLLMGKPARP